MGIGQQVLPGVDPPPSAALSQWFTKPELARRIVEWSGAAGCAHVLEPSAGAGAFVEPLLDLGCRVQAVEIDPPWADRLRLRNTTPKLQVACWDFLAWDPGFAPGQCFDLTVMNPIYEDGQDMFHVKHACNMSDRVVALVRAVFLNGVERYEGIWRTNTLERVIHFKDRPKFSGAGSPRHDFCVVDLRTGGGGPPYNVKVDWWYA